MNDGETFVFPPAPYLPGRTARPDDAFFEPLKAGLDAEMDIAALTASAAFRGGRDAFDQGYYWEAHELWEAVWMCLPPASAEKHLLRGLIQFANTGLKRRMGKDRAAERIILLAREALREAYLHRQGDLMGLSTDDIESMEAKVCA